MSLFDLFNNHIFYCSITGNLFWKKPTNTSILVGSFVGAKTAKGYLRFQFLKKKYLAHRVVWFLHNKEWPSNQIDHINGVRSYNRIANLRDVTNRQNSINQKIHRNGKLPGAIFHRRSGRYRPKCIVKGKCYYFGSYETAIEAHEVYMNFLNGLKNGSN